MTAVEIRRYVLGVHAPAAQEEADREGEGQAWFVGSCDSACAVLEEELGEALLPFGTVWGGFQVGRHRSGHVWLAAPDGTIIDPTSEQFGLEACAIIPPDDPRQSWYRQEYAMSEARP